MATSWRGSTAPFLCSNRQRVSCWRRMRRSPRAPETRISECVGLGTSSSRIRGRRPPMPASPLTICPGRRGPSTTSGSGCTGRPGCCLPAGHRIPRRLAAGFRGSARQHRCIHARQNLLGRPARAGVRRCSLSDGGVESAGVRDLPDREPLPRLRDGRGASNRRDTPLSRLHERGEPAMVPLPHRRPPPWGSSAAGSERSG